MQRHFAILAISGLVLSAVGGCNGVEPCAEGAGTCPTAGARRCHPTRAAIQTCLTGADGCQSWTDSGECGPHDRCDELNGPAACVCQHQCPSPGALECRGSSVVRCDVDGNGCLFQQPQTDCAETGQTCDASAGAQCVGTCTDGCDVDNETRCDGTAIQTCSAGSDGCRRWLLAGDCADNGQFCDNGSGAAACVDTCSNQCNPLDATRCDGSWVQSCRASGSGCLGWYDSVDCAQQGQVCDPSSQPASCRAGCSGDCDSADATRCAGDLVEVCRAGTDGCLRWQEHSDCAVNQQTCAAEGSNHLCRQVGGSVPLCGLCRRDDQCAGFSGQYGGRYCQPLQSGAADFYCLQDCTQNSGLCQPGETCDANKNCVPAAGCGVTLCSSSAPAGACAPGLVCQTGRCVDAAACSSDNQTGTCPAGLTCVGGSCIQTTTSNMPIGGPCASESQCATANAVCYAEESGGQATGWIQGYCMLFDCASASCPAGSSCVTLQDGSVCFDECQFASDCRAGYNCAPGGNGRAFCEPWCDAGSCPTGYVCQGGICITAPCTSQPNSCEAGHICVDGRCVADIGTGPGDNLNFPLDQLANRCPNLPAVECTAGAAACNAIVFFDPVLGPGYDNYPINGETTANQYRSYLRRDLMMLVKYAAAYVDCLATGWAFGNGGRVGLGDMSEQNGAIPGTSINDPGHPAGTHTNGFDLDIGYFQVDTPDNRLRPICDHFERGVDAYHCTAAPHLLDPWRTALFIAALHEHPALRVIGADGKAGPLIESAFRQLCSAGWIKSAVCSAGLSLAYEETDQGRGWFLFHHHHFHVSFSQPSYHALASGDDECLIPGCEREPLRQFLESRGVSTSNALPQLRIGIPTRGSP